MPRVSYIPGPFLEGGLCHFGRGSPNIWGMSLIALRLGINRFDTTV